MDDEIPDLIDIDGNKILDEQNTAEELTELLEKSGITDAKYFIVIMSEMCHKSKLICLKKLEEKKGDIVLALVELL
jgi:hypothetical protein